MVDHPFIVLPALSTVLQWTGIVSRLDQGSCDGDERVANWFCGKYHGKKANHTVAKKEKNTDGQDWVFVLEKDEGK